MSTSTPREVIRLMVNVLFIEDDEALTKPGVVRSIYDPTAGTGGMLSVADEHLASHNPNARLGMYGQGLNPESYAICKSEMLIKGQDIGNIVFGNTFSDDGLPGRRFDYMLSNPPFGVEWKKIEKEIRREAERRRLNQHLDDLQGLAGLRPKILCGWTSRRCHVDLAILHSTSGAAGLVEVMRTLWNEPAARGRGFNRADFSSSIEAVAGPRVNSMVGQMVDETRPPPYDSLLAFAGHGLERTERQLPALGMVRRTVERGHEVVRIPPAGAADRAGLRVSDIVLAIDDRPVASVGFANIMAVTYESIPYEARSAGRRTFEWRGAPSRSSASSSCPSLPVRNGG